MKNIFKKTIVFFLVFNLAFSNLPYDFVFGLLSVLKPSLGEKSMAPLEKLAQNLGVSEVQAAAAGDGRLLYAKSTNDGIYQRIFTAPSTVSGETNVLSGFTDTVRYIRLKAAPTRDEMIAVVQAAISTTGSTILAMRWNGSAWSVDWCVRTGGGTIGGTACTNATYVSNANTVRRGFDIEYENTSGDALVLYSSGAATTNEMKYRTWNGSVWSSELNLDTARLTGIVSWVELVPKMTTSANEIQSLFSDANADLSGIAWDGAAFTAASEHSVVLEAALEDIGTGTHPTIQSFDGAYETATGDFIAAWGFSSTADVRYATRPTGSNTWTITTNTTFPEIATFVDMAEDADTASNYAGFVSSDPAALDNQCVVWSGTAWPATPANCDTGAGAGLAGWHTVRIAFLKNTVKRALVVYGDGATAGLDWYSSDPATNTWTVGTDFAITGATSAVTSPMELVADPLTAGIAMAVVQKGTGIHMLKASMNTSGVTSWSNPNGAAIATSNTTSLYQPFSFSFVRYVSAPSQTLTIGVTAGSKVTVLNSGDTSQYAQVLSCASAAACAAFTLSLNSGSDTVTSIKITETGTADATNNLANLALFYDTDGNYSNGVTGQYGSTVAAFTAEAATVSGSLVVNSGTTYYFYVRFDLAKTSTYPKGGQGIDFQIAANADVVSGGTVTKTGAPVTLTSAASTCATATQTCVKPNATGSTFGSGLSDGARSTESITISGFGFGVAPVGSRGNCAGAVDTGCVRLTVGGNATVDTGDVSAWSNTSISLTVNAALASYGGASAMEVVSGSQSDATKITYYIYPNITGMATCSAGGDRDSACGTNAAQEYLAGDTFGLIQLNGDHFNTTAGTVQFTGGFGTIAATVHGTAEGPCTVAGWGATGMGSSVCVEVNATISNTVYDGTVTLTRTGDSKTDVIDLHILPRIASNTPTATTVGSVVQIDGDHLCQTGTCPPTPPTTDYIAYFGSTQAISTDFVTTPNCSGASKWGHTQVCVKVPSGTPTGTQKTKLQGKLSPLYESQRKDFTVQSTIPNTPTVTEPPSRQYKSDNTTVIAIGSGTTESTVILKSDITASLSINMRLQIEVQPVGTSFTCTGTNAIGVGGCTAYASGSGVLEGTVVGGGGCDACTSLSQAKITFTSLSDSNKHWQARARNSTTSEHSAWVSFGANPETSVDFSVDTSAPVITNISSGTPGTNSATITWDTTGESSTSQVQYNKTGTFGDCPTDCTTLDSNLVFTHSVPLSNLDSGTTYYYRVRSKDSAGNEAVSSNNTFATTSVVKPAKTTSFYITSQTSQIPPDTLVTSRFTVLVPETSPTIKSAFVEVTGVVSGGTGVIDINVNSGASRSYDVSAANPTKFRFIIQIPNPDTEANLNLNDGAPCTNGLGGAPPCNKLEIATDTSISVNIASAKILLNYAYTP
ncbi:MAG: hypothetical protein UY55_C0008G0006 [Candidatus Jorgensenbacteria bacterium GW2011_GWB1_50_10]|uniref:Fibronectin type-III domain-containing protein n=1 Tax=Candidatus Jorgensenbacteria bacterium GW2011_GWB1_50_10 TaxID=1618665 RepID=A0A0G1W6U6_9BACT|nr:MAG: hypothetical protein UY55_C0008G0006 [Candidatus Jorgensenbacteria bacterium GW2011_GWB1_50_10]